MSEQHMLPKLTAEGTASACCRLPTRGYTFATWLRVDDMLLTDASAGRSLFTLLWRSTSGDNAARGVSAALKGEPAHTVMNSDNYFTLFKLDPAGL